MVRVVRKSPAELTVSWPDVASDDVAGEAARRVALVLREGIDAHGLRGFARLIEADHATLLGVVNGRTWPSVALIARAERFLGRPVWPGL